MLDVGLKDFYFFYVCFLDFIQDLKVIGFRGGEG